MRICIRRGTQQIGGPFVEIESDCSRILLERGLPLDAEGASGALFRGLTEPDPLLGVVLSHSHRDHGGLLPMVTCRYGQ